AGYGDIFLPDGPVVIPSGCVPRAKKGKLELDHRWVVGSDPDASDLYLHDWKIAGAFDGAGSSVLCYFTRTAHQRYQDLGRVCPDAYSVTDIPLQASRSADAKVLS